MRVLAVKICRFAGRLLYEIFCPKNIFGQMFYLGGVVVIVLFVLMSLCHLVFLEPLGESVIVIGNFFAISH